MGARAGETIDDPTTPTTAPSQAIQVDSLTGLRGFAALAVVAVHASGRTDFDWFGIHGYGPVSLFVLSGFLLYRPWSRWALGRGRRPETRTFARRRLLRIFPAYLVVMLTIAVMLPASQPNGWDGWLRAFTLTGTFASDGLRPGFEQTWSLGTELSWYVALPVLGLVAALVAHRLTGRRAFYSTIWLLALSVPVTVLWRVWTEVEDLGKEFTYSFWLPGFLVCFAAGAAVAHFLEGETAGLVDLTRIRGWFRRSWVLLAVVVTVIVICNSSLGGPTAYVPASFSERQVRFFCSTLLAVILLLAAVLSRADSPQRRLMSCRPLTAIGRWSYGIYLWHLPVIVLLENDFTHRTGVGGFLLWLSCILAISIPLGAATYAWVESPAIAWSKRGVRRS
ncbi:acyltransferase [Nocardioides marmoriginsengisoli]|uniref:Acyltransferase n=1 Tax=Nocardioides marmoriginsengisoli TaxID=661483 RepID=A0A3N0CPH2_9ACTN|nr:acyltransferase [Nocardioides marmoriginsengisoli]RNL64936.1 acyltransferase [Nocardioides marmoriginsengisoli]